MTIWSVYRDIPRQIPSSCYKGTEQLQGPFSVPNDWFHLLDPFLNPTGVVCFNDGLRYSFLSFLLILQAMMFIWFYTIVRIAIRVIRGQGAEDLRSDGEEEEEAEEEPYYVEGRPLELGVGVEELDLKAWERRTSMKSHGSSTGVTMPLSDPKAFLNRVGCEKKID
jgi:acyl-CoA-dependent ceramide synthase